MSSNPNDIEARLTDGETPSSDGTPGSDRRTDNVVDFVIVGAKRGESPEADVAENDSESEHVPSPSGSLVRPGGLSKRYSIEDLRRLSDHLPKATSVRYSALVVNMWKTSSGSPRFEIALVNVRNGDVGMDNLIGVPTPIPKKLT